MNEVEYILRIVLKARDELATTLKKAREELRLFANAADSNKAKIDGFNDSIEKMSANVGNITDKFKEWREVIQGTAGGNDDAKKSFGDLGREVEATNKSTTRTIRTQKEYVQSASRLNQEIKNLSKAHKEEGVSADYAATHYKELGRQLENLSKKMNTGTRDSKRAFEWAQNAKQAAEQIVAAKQKEARAYEQAEKDKLTAIQSNNSRIAREIQDQIKREGDAEKARVAAVKRGNAAIGREIQQQIRDEHKASQDRIKNIENENREFQKAIEHQQQIRRASERGARAQQRLSGGGLGTGDVVEIRQSAQALDRLARSTRSSEREAHRLGVAAEELKQGLRGVASEGDRSGSVFARVSHYFDRNKESVAGLDNTLRGMGWLLAAGFAQQLISVLGGLAGSFVAVASSAAEAGAAIGGAFVAGIGQALPSIGLLGAAMVRVSSVMDAVKQQQLAQKQAFTQGADAGKRVADATDTIKNAQEALGNSSRGIVEAQRRLTKARSDARRELVDLAQAEKQADLAARGAALSQKEAQEQLRQAMQTGDVSGIQRAELGVLEAKADAEEKLTAKTRTRREAEKGRAAGVEGAEGVQDAKRGLEDAERTAVRANRQMETAKRNAGEAAKGADTAASSLQFFIQQLSPAEKRLYEAITAFQTLFREGVYRDITDNIINSFARTVERVTQIIQMPKVVLEARKTAVQIGRQLNRLTDAFTSDDMVKQFLRIAEAGRKNLSPLTDIAISVGKSLANIAEAAGPSLSRILRFIRGLVQSFEDLTGHRRKLTQFFDEGEKHFEAWIKLGLAVIQLFMALVGAGGASSGLKTIEDATKAIDDLTEKVNDNKDAVADFFEDARKITYEVVGVIQAVAVELARTFTPERVEGFTDLLKTVLIPALGDAVHYMGEISNFLLQIAESPAGREILKLGVALFFVSKILLSSLGVVKGFIDSLKFFIEPIGKLLKYLPGMSRLVAIFEEMGAIEFLGAAGGIGLIVGAIIFLLAKLGLLDEVWGEIQQAFKAMMGQIEPPLHRFIASFQDLWDAISEGKGAFAALEPVLRILIKVGGFLLEGVFKAIGQVIGGIIDVIGGLMDVVTGLLTGDFSKVLEGLKDIFRGLANIIIGGLQLLLFRGMGGLFRGALRLFGNGMKALGGLLVDVLKGFPKFFLEAAEGSARLFWRGIRALGRLIADAARDGWNYVRHLPGRFWELAKDIARLFWRGYRALGRYLRRGIEEGWEFVKRLPGRFWDLAKDIVSSFWRGYRNLGRLLRRGIEEAWDWLKGFPGRFQNLAKDAVRLFIDAFRGLGKSIIDVLSTGLSGAGNFAKKLINGIFKLIEDGWNKGVGGKKVLGVSLPDIKIPRLAAGGPVPGSGSGDRVPALLEPGEHVWTKAEVRRAGGHAAMFAFRALFGGGTQAPGRGMALGGVPGAGAGSLTIAFEGGSLDDFRSTWRRFWTDLVTTARRGTSLVEDQFKDLRDNSAQSTDQMYKKVRASIADIEHSFDIRGDRIVKGWANTWNSLQQVAYDGLFYIAHETNRALTGLEEKHINFGLSPPKKAEGKAGGGFIGGKGQRGRDSGLYALGAGEAVLNWGHQRYVESALHAQYGFGLQDLFSRTHGYHAGGNEQPGFASGGIVPIPGQPGESINSSILGDVVKLIRQYKLTVYDGFGGSPPHAPNSDHKWGGAIDVGPGPGGSWSLVTKLANWAEPTQNQPRKPFRWVGYTGDPGHGEGNHLHLSWLKGAHLTGAFGDTFKEIARRIVSGPDGGLKDIVQSGMDKVLKVANKYVEKAYQATFETSEPGDVKVGDVGPGASNIFKFFKGRGFTDEQAAAWVGNFQQESGLDPSAVQPNGEGHGLAQWGGGRFAALQAFAKAHGKPWQDMGTQLAFVMYELNGPESAAKARIKGSRTLEDAVDAVGVGYERFGIQGDRYGPAKTALRKFGGKFAEGGVVPGGDGEPIPILAHAQEWILNKGQQSRLARALGISRDAIKAFLGFPGHKGRAFQTGGEVGGDVEGGAADEALLNKGITSKAMLERIRKIRQGIYELPMLPIQSWAAALREAKRAFLAINRRGKALSAQVQEINKQIKELEKGDETKAETAKIKKLKTERKALIEGGTMVKEIAKINGQIKELQKGDEDRQQNRQIARLRVERRKLQRQGRSQVALQARLKTLEALTGEGGIIETMDAQRERYTARLSRGLTFATYHFRRGNQRVTKELNDVQIATRELDNARKEFTKTLGEEGIITKGLKKVNNRLATLRKGGISEKEAPEVRELVAMQVWLRDQRASIRETHASQLQAIYEAQVARQQAVVDEINSRAERGIARTEITRRIGEAVGNEGMIDAANQAARAIQQQQMQELQARVAAASKIGNTEMVNSLNAQIVDLRTTIFESIQQELRDAQDRINERAQRRLGRLDLGTRMLDAIGAVGLGSIASVAGEQFTRGGLFAQRQGVLEGQRGELQGLLGRAGAAGNMRLVQELTDQLAELDVTIQENTKAYFDARVEDVNSRAEFGLNIADLNKQILDLGGIVDDNTAQQTVVATLQAKDQILRNKEIELRGLLAEAQRTGNQQAVNDLTVAIKENYIATLQNTQAIEEANGLTKDPQSFSSSAWTRFREAIFTGMGQVLPQYDPANMGGAVVTGASISPAMAGGGSSRVSGDTNINLYEAGRPIDLQEISSAVSFASKTVQ